MGDEKQCEVERRKGPETQFIADVTNIHRVSLIDAQWQWAQWVWKRALYGSGSGTYMGVGVGPLGAAEGRMEVAAGVAADYLWSRQ